MNERIDNLDVKLIEDKKKFFVEEVLTKNVDTTTVICVNVTAMSIKFLYECDTDEIVDMISKNNYSWLVKEHV